MHSVCLVLFSFQPQSSVEFKRLIASMQSHSVLIIEGVTKGKFGDMRLVSCMSHESVLSSSLSSSCRRRRHHRRLRRHRRRHRRHHRRLRHHYHHRRRRRHRRRYHHRRRRCRRRHHCRRRRRHNDHRHRHRHDYPRDFLANYLFRQAVLSSDTGV